MRMQTLLAQLYLFAMSSAASAAVTVYQGPRDRGEWFAAISNNYSRIDFVGFSEYTIITTQYAPSGVTFTDATDRINHDVEDFPNDGAGLHGATYQIRVRFSEPMYWVGMDLPGSAAIELYSHGQLIYANPDYFHTPDFLGFVSDMPFNELYLHYTSAGIVRIDDLFFGPPITAPPPVTPIARIAHQGQTVSYNGNPVTLATLRAPFTNALGQVGFTGDTSIPGDSFVWFDDGITFLNSDEQQATLTGTEMNIGISDKGGFAFSPFHNGLDSIHTHAGALLVMGDPLPGNPPAFATTQVRWPSMQPAGAAYFISNYGSTPNGPVDGSALFRCVDPADPGTIRRVLGTGDLVDGFPIERAPGYDLSDSEEYRIDVVELDKVTETDDFRLLVNGEVVLRQGEPTGHGDNWGYLRDIGVNNRGDYIFGATTDLPGIANDTVIGYNAQEALREGMIVDNAGLGQAPSSLSINNLGMAVFMWHLNPAGEGLFYGNADNLPGAVAVLRTGDLVDYSGDGVADAGVVDFNTTIGDHHCLSLSDHDFIYVEVDLLDVGSNTPYEAIIRVPLPPISDCPANIATGPGSETSVNIDDLLMVIGAWGPCPVPPQTCPANIVTAGASANAVDIDDLLAVISAWGPCS